MSLSNNCEYDISYWQLNKDDNVQKYKPVTKRFSSLLEAEEFADSLNERDSQHMAEVEAVTNQE